MPTSDSCRPLRPLVVGSPRSGFTLLCSVVIHLVPLRPGKRDLRQRMLGRVVDSLGDSVADTVVSCFRENGIADDLIYSPNFRKLTGGPKWLSERNLDEACFRKYIGVRGIGDFSLVTGHPREVLDHDEVLHSHSSPMRWLEHPGYADCSRFASLRNPAGCVVSSCLSINALTSEYIQRFVPEELDNHDLRTRLAYYKFTDLDFFSGLASFYRRYFEEFLEARDHYIVMKWEDLLTEPHATITELGARAGIEVPPKLVSSIWSRLSHKNLTGDHKHNFRPGGGVVDDWLNWLTNDHLAILRDHGYERLLAELGYDSLPTLDPGRYTPFQTRVAEMIRSGRIFTDYDDRDLFRFAFNKSNLDSEKFPFRRYDWKSTTRVERSDFDDEELLQRIWDTADAAVARLNRLLARVLESDYRTEQAARDSSAGLVELARELGFGEPARHALGANLDEELARSFAPAGVERTAR